MGTNTANRTIRYQGAILRGSRLLLIQHREHRTRRTYWLFPGGGREAGETEEECVQREMMEETGLEVRIVRLLLDEESRGGAIYQRYRTYLCDAPRGEARPGYEPEEDAAAHYAISKVEWFDLTGHRPRFWN